MIPRRMKSMRIGASPVFTMCPPTITTTPRFPAAFAMSRASARKSRAASTSGSAPRKAANERSSPGGVANSSARTLFGRRAIGTVRTRGEVGFGSAQPGGIVGGVYDLRKRSRVLSTGIFALS